MSDADSLLEFPCEFPIKMMGKAGDTFVDTARQLVERHAGSLSDDQLQTKTSSNGNFISVTITIQAHSQAQLDDIYQDLTDHDAVLVAL